MMASCAIAPAIDSAETLPLDSEVTVYGQQEYRATDP